MNREELIEYKQWSKDMNKELTDLVWNWCTDNPGKTTFDYWKEKVKYIGINSFIND